MGKKLCKLAKEDYVEEHFKAYAEMVVKPKYICKKCGRAANDETYLCKPKKIKEKE